MFNRSVVVIAVVVHISREESLCDLVPWRILVI
jgi:hypothetical protein